MKKSLTLFLLTHCLFTCLAIRTSVNELLDMDEQQLSNVMTVYTNPGDLGDDSKRSKLIEMSRKLSNVRTLELDGQNIDDDFLRNLFSSSFPRLINLSLKGNESVTSEGIQAILDDEVVGSIRDLPQYSSRYGLPSSEIRVSIARTNVLIEEIIDNPRFDFTIKYLHPHTSKMTAPVAYPALKWLLFND